MANILRRYFEMLVGCIICSLFFVYAKDNTQFTSSLNALKIVGIILLLLYLMFNGFVIKFLYFKTEDGFDYYFYNISGLVLFLLTALAIKILCSESVYMLLFSLTNVFYYVFSEINGVISVVLFICTVLLTFYLADKYYERRL